MGYDRSGFYFLGYKFDFLLNFNYLTEWKIGLERLDPVNKGYEKGNVALVCQEFNAIDRSCHTKKESGGWTQDKFRYFLNFVKEKYAGSNELHDEM